MQGKARALLRNPVVIIVPFVLLALTGWNYYLDTVASAPNRAVNNQLVGGDFEHVGKNGIPSSWELASWGGASYTSAQRKPGYMSEGALYVRTDEPQSGGIALATPKAKVTPGLTYLYKSYFRSDVSFEIIAEYEFRNGRSERHRLRAYESSRQWSMIGVAVQAPADVRRMRIVHKVADDGAIWLDGAYLDIRDDVSPSEPPMKQKVDPMAIRAGECVIYRASYTAKELSDVRLRYRDRNDKEQETPLSAWLPAIRATVATVAFEAPQDLKRIVAVRVGGGAVIETERFFSCTRRPKKTFDQPMVTIAVDSESKATAMIAPRILEWNRIHATFYVPMADKAQGSTLDGQDVSILRKGGHQVALLDPLDISTLAASQLHRRLALARGELREHWGVETVDLAMPRDTADAEVRSYIERYYRSLRGESTGVNYLATLDPYALRTITVTPETSMDDLKSLVAQARSSKGWLILVYRGVGHDTADMVDAERFTDHMRLIKGSGIKTVTIDEGLAKAH